MLKIKIWTDGSANWKTGRGGCACVIKYDGKQHILSKGLRNTRTGRAELHAILMALKAVKKKDSQVTLYSDSQYCVKPIMEKWLWKWREEYYFDAKGHVRPNRDLWEQLITELNAFKEGNGSVQLVHVKGHSGVPENEIADGFADYSKFSEDEIETDLSDADMIADLFEKERFSQARELQQDKV